MAGENFNEAGDLRAIRTATEALAAGGGGGGPVTIADGEDVALGAVADAVVAAGAAGTVSAKLRRATTDLAAILAAVDGLEGFTDGIEAGLALLATAVQVGEVQASPTANTILDRLKTLATLLTTQAGYLDGVEGLLAGTLATRPADGILTCTTSITRPADTNAYTANDALSDSTSAPTSGGFTFSSAVRASGKTAILTDVLVLSSNNAATTLQGELYIFDTAVTNINDNAAFGFSDGELLTLVAKVPFTLVQGTNNSHHHVQNLNIAVTTVGSANLRFLVKVLNAYTPASAEVITVRAKFLPVD